jgi:hypothetical protein
MPPGYIFVHRKIIEWEWYTDADVMRVFLHLLVKANYENKFWHGIEVKRGQLITGRKRICEELGISEQSVRTALKKLKLTDEIKITLTNKFSLITVNRYKDYQSTGPRLTNNQPAEYVTNKKCYIKSTNKLTNNKDLENQDSIELIKLNNKQLTNNLTNDQPTTNQQLTTTKEAKNIKKDNKSSIEKKSKEYLKTEECRNEILNTFNEYQISVTQYNQIIDTMLDWVSIKGRVVKDYKAQLRNWIRKQIEFKKLIKKQIVNQPLKLKTESISLGKAEEPKKIVYPSNLIKTF